MLSRIWRGIWQSVLLFVEKDAATRGAAISFYAVTSLAPVLLIVVSVAGIVYGEQAARGAIVNELGGLLGNSGAELIQGILLSVANLSKGIFAAIIGILTILF